MQSTVRLSIVDFSLIRRIATMRSYKSQRYKHRSTHLRLNSNCTNSSTMSAGLQADSSLLDCSEAAVEDAEYFKVIPNFVSSEEEIQLMADIRGTLKGKKYQFDHWDGAIEGYRETEKSSWSEVNTPVISRLKGVAQTAVPNKTLKLLDEVHVLDLADEGYIRPHVDSVKFCGEVICGISLLSASVMQLQHEEDKSKWIHALLPRLSLYILRGVVRYKYTHAILANESSVFKGQHVVRERRVSVISRTKPERSQ